MNRSLLPTLLMSVVLTVATACGRSMPRDMSVEDVNDPVSSGDTGRDFTWHSERREEGIHITLRGWDRLYVGQTAQFRIDVNNDSYYHRPEDPFSFRQEKAELTTTGPIVLGELEGSVEKGEQSYPLEYEYTRTSSFDVTCTAAGNATITFRSEGQSGITSPESAYSITIGSRIECIAHDYVGWTNSALRFSQDSLNWVAFEENGIVLRINQIEPAKLEVGDSVEIYSDFRAGDTFGDGDRELRDAKLEFTGGGPIRIDSTVRQSDLNSIYSELFAGNQAVVWGFRSGTLTCLDEGEGVYSSQLTGFLAKGGTITQIVSGLVDCEEPPAEAVLDAPPMIRPVYTIDGRPYDRVQFQYDEGHDGSLPHLHSNVTVYPYQEWYVRGSPDAPMRKTGDAPLTDPDPGGRYGYGAVMNLGNPSSVVVSREQVLELCDRLEFDRETASDLEARNLSAFREVCDSLRD